MSIEAENEEPTGRVRPKIDVEMMTPEPEGEENEEPGEEAEVGGEAEEGATGEQADADAEAAGGEGDDEAEQPKKRQPWQTKRIGELTRQKAEKDAQLTAANEKIAALEAAQTGGEGGGKLYTEAEVAARIDSVASEKAKAARLDERLDAMFETGTKTHKDFAERIDGYVNAFGRETLAKHTDFFEAVAELPNAADVIHALGGDLDQMAEILEMPGYKMGMALKDVSDKLAKPKSVSVSRAPAPIKPLEVINNSELPLTDPRVPMDEWVTRRRAERETARAAKNR